MIGRLAGKRAVITGAAQGIGRAIAEAFAAEGADLLLADIDAARLTATAAELGHEGIIIDVARKAEIERLFARIGERWGGLDILVNNAGVTHAANLDELTEEDFDRVMATNLKSALWATQAAARMMTPGSAVVNISSVNAVLGIPNQIPYALSKAALKQLTNVTALALAPKGIRVNAVGPGSIMTEMLKGIMTDRAAEDRILSRTPKGPACQAAPRVIKMRRPIGEPHAGEVECDAFHATCRQLGQQLAVHEARRGNAVQADHGFPFAFPPDATVRAVDVEAGAERFPRRNDVVVAHDDPCGGQARARRHPVAVSAPGVAPTLSVPRGQRNHAGDRRHPPQAYGRHAAVSRLEARYGGRQRRRPTTPSSARCALNPAFSSRFATSPGTSRPLVSLLGLPV